MIYGYETLESHRHRILCFLPLIPKGSGTQVPQNSPRVVEPRAKPLMYIPSSPSPSCA